MRGFKSARSAQRLFSALAPITGDFRRSRHKQPAGEYQAQREQRFHSGNEITGAQLAA
jgi:hypothetical protein